VVDPVDDSVTLFVDDLAQVASTSLGYLAPLFRELDEKLDSGEESG
jgi:hypothetical protein